MLVDSEPLSFRAWADVLGRHGYELISEIFSDTVGGTERDVALRFAPMVDGDVDALEKEARSALLDLLAGGAEAFTDAVTLANRLARLGIPVGVASNSPRWRLDAVLTAAGLEHLVPLSIAGDEVAAPKPAPDVYREMVVRLGSAPDRCLVVEDSPTGIRAAVGAGCRVVAVDRGMFAAEALAGADIVVRGL